MHKYIIVAAIAFGACEGKAAKATQPTPAPQQIPSSEPPAQSNSTTVDVAPGGSKFDPPVAAKELPAGVWYCDMGTVHYARPDEGDGKCAICGMKLKQKSEEGADGHDHQH